MSFNSIKELFSLITEYSPITCTKNRIPFLNYVHIQSIIGGYSATNIKHEVNQNTAVYNHFDELKT